MAGNAVVNEQGRRVLRRRSWPVLSWGSVAIIWAIFPLGVLSSLTHQNHRDIWVVAAVFCAVTAVLRRIGSCKVILLCDSLTVENPLVTYEVPYGTVRAVEAAAAGGLEVEAPQGEIIHPFCFGGSLVDAYFRSTTRAAAEVQDTVNRRRHRPGAQGEVTRRFRRCWSDALVPLAVIFGTVSMFVSP
ncbi:hypothetical protein [Streptomyces flavofungini]|uniref:hypothetical protein n=1 Tax=Streptomyces flavofungini TaxID=68200 RepID=UPI0025B2311C|nr:hypothetical protein [Streptomyces flavofungini]WJV45585.1 hypothetical protein QUY26_08580 [Streptomyces flavofungini]